MFFLTVSWLKKSGGLNNPISNGAGGSPAEAIIWLLFGDACDRAGPFLKFEKNCHMAARKTAVRFHLKTAVFCFSFKTVTALATSVKTLEHGTRKFHSVKRIH